MSDEYTKSIVALSHDPKHKDARRHIRELVLTTWVQVATEGENEAARTMAAEKLAKRVGLPEEPTINVNLNQDDLGSLSDEQLAAKLARLRAAISADAGDTDPPGDGAAEAGEPDRELPAVSEAG